MTTFSDSYGIKKIGAGLERNTWGASTNENFERIEAAIGGSITLDLLAMPLSSTSASIDGTTAATWITVDQATQGAVGSEGRTAAIVVTGSVTGTATLEIRGNSSGVVPSRVLHVKNSLGNSQDLILDGNGTSSVTIANGSAAFVAVRPTAATGFEAGVVRLDDSPEFSSVKLAGVLEFLNASYIEAVASNANAFRIQSGGNRYFGVDTSNDKLTVDIGNLEFNDPVTNVITTALTNNAAALSITDTTDSFVTVDTTTGDKKVIVGSANVDTTITSGEIDLTNSAKVVDIAESELESLLITDSATGDEYVAIDTVGKDLILGQLTSFASSMRISETDGYINTTDTVGAGGYGFRSVSDEVQFRTSGTTWSKMLMNLLATPSAASAGASGTYQFAIDIGPIRVIMNTVQVAHDTTITLGNSSTGTAHNMASRLYNVMVCAEGDTNGEQRNVGASVLSATGRTFKIYGQATADPITYIAFGDN